MAQVSTKDNTTKRAYPVTETVEIPQPISIPPNCPPGLEYLLKIDNLFIKQKVEHMEAITGFETANKYAVFNGMGQRVYFAAEKSDCCTRNCCGTMRRFKMTIVDNKYNEVIYLHRPWRPCSKCTCACCSCCLQTIDVYAPKYHLIGRVREVRNAVRPKYKILDANDETVLEIKGPWLPCSWKCGEVEFQVCTTGGEEVGIITKEWSGSRKEMFTDADNFGVLFPGDLDVNVKATLLAAVFLIDFMFFESKGKNDTNNAGRY